MSSSSQSRASSLVGGVLSAAVCTAALCWAGWMIYSYAETGRMDPLPGLPDRRGGEGTPDPRAAAKAKVEQALAEADRQSEAAAAERLKAVRAFFARAKRGAPAFAEDALSWSGKWALIQDRLDISDGREQERKLREAFARRVFSPDDMKAAVEGVVRGYLSDLEGLENDWLVRLRADLSDGDLARSERLPHLHSDEGFRAEYARLAAEVAPVLAKDLEAEVGRQAFSFVAGEVATQVLVHLGSTVAAEMGISAGVLGAGAASGVATFGVGIVAGIAVDYVLEALLKELGYDPEKEVADKVCGALDRLERLVAGEKGLAGEMAKVHKARSELRRRVALRLLAPEGGE